MTAPGALLTPCVVAVRLGRLAARELFLPLASVSKSTLSGGEAMVVVGTEVGAGQVCWVAATCAPARWWLASIHLPRSTVLNWSLLALPLAQSVVAVPRFGNGLPPLARLRHVALVVEKVIDEVFDVCRALGARICVELRLPIGRSVGSSNACAACRLCGGRNTILAWRNR